MDKEWIRIKLQDFDSAAKDCGDYDEVVPLIDEYSEAIAQVHEEEVAQLQAQVAVMAEALQSLLDYVDDVHKSQCGHPTMIDVCKKAEQAISAAPRVLTAFDAKLAYNIDQVPVLKILAEEFKPRAVMVYEPAYTGQDVKVLVLAHESAQPEQPQSSEQEEE